MRKRSSLLLFYFFIELAFCKVCNFAKTSDCKSSIVKHVRFLNSRLQFRYDDLDNPVRNLPVITNQLIGNDFQDRAPELINRLHEQICSSASISAIKCKHRALIKAKRCEGEKRQEQIAMKQFAKTLYQLFPYLHKYLPGMRQCKEYP